MSDFLTKYHCILDYQSDRVGWSRLSMHAARCRYLLIRNYRTPHMKIFANSFAFIVTVQAKGSPVVYGCSRP